MTLRDDSPSLFDLMLLYATGIADAAERAEAERLLDAGDKAAVAALAEAERVVAGLAATAGRAGDTAAAWATLRAKLPPRGEATPDGSGWGDLVEAASKPLPASTPAWSTSLRGSRLLAAALAAVITLMAAYVAVRPRLERLAVAEAEVEEKIRIQQRVLAERDEAVEQAREADAALAIEQLRTTAARRDASIAAQQVASLRAERDEAQAALAEARADLAIVQRRAETLTREYAAAEQRAANAEAIAVATAQRVSDAEAALRLALSPASSLATLNPTGEQPGARGDAVLNREQNQLRLAVAGLAPAAAERTYQAWALPAEGAPVPLGTFQVGVDGEGTLSVDLPALPDNLANVAVSLAPAGGDSGPPTGPIVLVGELR